MCTSGKQVHHRGWVALCPASPVDPSLRAMYGLMRVTFVTELLVEGAVHMFRIGQEFRSLPHRHFVHFGNETEHALVEVACIHTRKVCQLLETISVPRGRPAGVFENEKLSGRVHGHSTLDSEL